MTYQHTDLESETLQAAIDKVALEGQRIILQRAGKAIAALVPLEEVEILQELEELEDKLDLEAAQEAMKEPGIVSWEEVKVRFGL